MKKMFIYIAVFLALFSCVEDEDLPVSDNETTNDSDMVTVDTSTDENEKDDTETVVDNEKQDEDVNLGAFCFSGDAILYEGDQQFKMCATDFNRVQKQICKNGKWVDEGNCLLNYTVVPDGEFLMGCDVDKEGSCEQDNTPLHELRLSEYSIDKFEVTAQRYQQCIASGFCNNDDIEKPHFQTSSESYKCNIDNSDRANHPANCVSWYGAKAFCEWNEMRLPTEAEWEKSARAGNVQIYPWGNSPEPDCDYAIMKTVSAGCGNNVTYPVGTTLAGISPFGLYNVAGNVAEYVSDWYSSEFYADELAQARDCEGPQDPGPGYDGYKVCRGGSYLYDERRTRTSYRSACKINDFSSDIGFRCAADKKNNVKALNFMEIK